MAKKQYNNRHRKPPGGIFFRKIGKFSNRMVRPSTIPPYTEDREQIRTAHLFEFIEMMHDVKYCN